MTGCMEDKEFRQFLQDSINEIKETVKEIQAGMMSNRDRITRLEATGVALRWAVGILLGGIAALGGLIAKILNSSK